MFVHTGLGVTECETLLKTARQLKATLAARQSNNNNSSSSTDGNNANSDSNGSQIISAVGGNGIHVPSWQLMALDVMTLSYWMQQLAKQTL
jgi:hypothetical protein